MTIWQHIEQIKNLYLDSVVIWILLISVYFTFKLGGVNLVLFKHACKTLLRGRDPEAAGELSPFQALSMALAGTVGLGNIVGPAFGIAIGGPGVLFWIAIAGILGMCAKFAEITMAHKYRFVDRKGRAVGGSFAYIKISLERLGQYKLGAGAAYLYAILLFLAILFGGSLFQSNQAVNLISEQYFGNSRESHIVLGLLFTALIGLSSAGSMRFMGRLLSKVLPIASMVFILLSLCVIVYYHHNFLPTIKAIMSDAFTGKAASVGILGVIFIGTKRAFYASVAGLGISTVIHSASQTKSPVREGCVGMLEPFLDTILVCTLCGLAVLVSDSISYFSQESIMKSGGIILANKAYGSVSPALSVTLHLCVVCFALSIMMSLRHVAFVAWNYLFHGKANLVFFAIYVGCVYIGAIGSFSTILDIADVIALSLAVPNNLALLLMGNEIKSDKNEYMQNLPNSKGDKTMEATHQSEGTSSYDVL